MPPSRLTHSAPLPDACRLPLSSRVALVKLDTVIAARGEYDYRILEHVDSGRLRWVFDLATKPGGMRDLRFWNREVSAFAATEGAELAAVRAADPRSVVNAILGGSQEFQPGEICLLLGISRPTLRQLRGEMTATGRKRFPRAGLEQFLKRRLLLRKPTPTSHQPVANHHS
jgi:hypothetical protein